VDYEILLYSRSAERLLIVLFAGCSLLFGYLLFFRATSLQGDLEAKGGDKVYLRLRNVAPGVFFALFGSGVLIVSLVYQISVPTGKGEVGLSLGMAPPELADRETAAKRVAAISALMTFYRDRAAEAVPGAERSALQSAIPVVDSIRGDLIDQVFGAGSYAFYQSIDARRSAGQSNVVETLESNQKSRFVEIDELMAYGILLEASREE
jgi:hypothetical protein